VGSRPVRLTRPPSRAHLRERKNFRGETDDEPKEVEAAAASASSSSSSGSSSAPSTPVTASQAKPFNPLSPQGGGMPSMSLIRART